MFTVHALLSVAMLIADGAEQTSPPIAELGSKAMFELCGPLIADQSFNETALLLSWGGRRVSDAADRTKYELETSDAGTVSITILSDRTVCAVHYVGPYSGIAEIEAGLVRDGWEGRAALTGNVWRQKHTFAATGWARENSDGPYEGLAYIARSDSDVAVELAEWFTP
ncbi:hypothetical protein D3C86_568730 [compost metagenome]